VGCEGVQDFFMVLEEPDETMLMELSETESLTEG